MTNIASRRRITAAVALTLAALGAICAGAVPAGAQTACAALGGTIDSEQLCQLHTVTPTYTIDISVPTDYPDQQALAAFLTEERDSFVDWVAKYGRQPRTMGPYLLDISAEKYRSGAPDAGTQSLVVEVQNDTGLAHEGHPDTSYTSFNYDLGKDAPITFDTLFTPGSKPLEMLDPIVAPALSAHGGPDVAPDLQEAGTDAYRNFAITDDAVIFFFGESQLRVSNNGPHQVSVPRSQLATILA